MLVSRRSYRIAAQTEAPQTGLDKAVDQQLSVRELIRGIQEQRDNVDEEEQYRAGVERVEQTVRKFNEAWETKRNIRAVLTWESAGFKVMKEAG